MQLSDRQRQFLERYKQFRHSPPTERTLFADLMVKMTATFMLTASAVATFTGLGYYAVAAFFAGIPVGAVLLSTGTRKTTVHLWPIFETVIDWNKVDELLEGSHGQPTE